MEFKVEVKEGFFESSERYLGSQLHRSTNNIEACKDKPDDKPEIEIKAEIKKELAQDEQGYDLESQLTTSIDLGNLKNEPDEDNSVHQKRSLWDLKSKPYHNKKLNKKLWKEIASQMKLGDRKEISKLNQKRNGDGADDKPQSKWHYFQNMAILKDQFTPRKRSGNIENGKRSFNLGMMRRKMSERYVGSQLHRSTNNIEGFSNDKPDDKTEIEIKAEIKKELAQDEQGYNIESQLTTSLDLGDLKNEPDEDNSDSDDKITESTSIPTVNVYDSELLREVEIRLNPEVVNRFRIAESAAQLEEKYVALYDFWKSLHPQNVDHDTALENNLPINAANEIIVDIHIDENFWFCNNDTIEATVKADVALVLIPSQNSNSSSLKPGPSSSKDNDSWK
ncbi:unnamed protein product [Diabrotica balteata]|uniref:MADF domain-containing protein n=1 Tax=Diabrotica balteata TaxID=107213 RepID=A0A9N9T828_DIABA|nr:unnamed protein product [Diabrotica balteata]